MHITKDPNNFVLDPCWQKSTDNSKQLERTHRDGKQYYLIARFINKPTTLQQCTRTVVIIAGCIAAIAAVILCQPMIGIPLAIVPVYLAHKTAKWITQDEGKSLKVYSETPTKEQKELIEKENRLTTFYHDKGIVEGNAPIYVDIRSLGFSKDELEQKGLVWVERSEAVDEGEVISFENAIDDVIQVINTILRNAHGDTLKKMRWIMLDGTQHPSIDQYYHLIGGESMDHILESQLKETWLYRIVKALKDQDHIFDIGDFHGSGLYLQA